MPLVDLIDETFIVADPATVAAALADPRRWRQWWPDLELAVFMDRGEQGVRWTVTGALVGSSELWLQRFGDGVIAHYFLRVDPTRGGSATEPASVRPRRRRRWAQRLARERALAWKRAVNALKDELEMGRPPGVPRVPAAV
jgi:hypothetical protein